MAKRHAFAHPLGLSSQSLRWTAYPNPVTAFLLAALIAFDETPEKTVRAFVDAFNARDFAAMAKRVVGQRKGEFPKVPSLPTLKVTLGEAKLDGDVASLEADVEMNGESEPEKAHETIHLRRTGDDWQIVPVDPNQGGMRENQFVGILAFLVINPDVMARARQAALRTACLSNVKQLSLGTAIYASDHGDRLPKDASRWKAAIMPYVKIETIFHCPADPSGAVSYFLDPRVAGKTTTSIRSPAETAMIVEGTPKKTAFRHAGRCSLGYVDGHARSADPSTVLKARTKPLK